MDRDTLYQQLAQIGHAASSPHRLRLLNLLGQGEKSVEQLATAIGQSVAATSAHLKVLRSVCLVETRKEGRNVFYRVAAEEMAPFWVALRRLGERVLPEVREVVRTYYSDPDSLAELSGRDLIDQVRQGRVTLLDLRPAPEYAAGHLLGARSVPAGELEEWMQRLPKRKPLVAYCRGPYCVTALESVRRMRDAGLNVRRLPLGIVEWRAAGLPVEPAATK